MQIYKGLDILTNKNDYNAIKNKNISVSMLNKYEALEMLDVHRFCYDALKAMDSDKDSINILEGGSPFYIRTLLRQMNDMHFDEPFFFESREEAKRIVEE